MQTKHLFDDHGGSRTLAVSPKAALLEAARWLHKNGMLEISHLVEVAAQELAFEVKRAKQRRRR